MKYRVLPVIPRWYVVNTHINAENTALTHLLQQGFECYFPLVYVDERVVPLFSGYFFTRFALNTRWQAILSTAGVKSLLGLTRASPSPVADTVVDSMINACVMHAGRAVLLPGLRIVITRGIHAGSTGIVEWSMPDRVALLMRILGREVSVIFTKDELEQIT